MKPRYAIAALFSAAIICLAGCDDGVDYPEPKLVIEGAFDSDGHPDIILTLSVVPDDRYTDISESLMRWATVSVSDQNGNTAVLTGSTSKRHFPPYHYYTYDIKGKPANKYTDHAKYMSLTPQKTVTRPTPPPNDSLTAERLPENDTLRALTVHFTAPRDCPAYYHISTYVEGRDRRYLPGTLGTAEAHTPGEHITVAAMRGKTSTDTLDFVPQMPVGARVAVKLERVDPEVYRFWREFSSAALFGHSQFFSSSFSLPTNIEGGLGVWSPQGVSEAIVEAEPCCIDVPRQRM